MKQPDAGGCVSGRISLTYRTSVLPKAEACLRVLIFGEARPIIHPHSKPQGVQAKAAKSI